MRRQGSPAVSGSRSARPARIQGWPPQPGRPAPSEMEGFPPPREIPGPAPVLRQTPAARPCSEGGFPDFKGEGDEIGVAGVLERLLHVQHAVPRQIVASEKLISHLNASCAIVGSFRPIPCSSAVDATSILKLSDAVRPYRAVDKGRIFIVERLRQIVGVVDGLLTRRGCPR